MNLVVPVILKADLPLEVWHANFGWNFRVGHVVTFQVLLPLVFLAQRSLAVLNFAVQVWKYLTLVNVCFGMIKLTLKVPNRVADIGITKCILLALGLDPLKVFLSILLQLNLSFFFTSETKDFFWNNRIKLKCFTHLIASWASRKSRRYKKEERKCHESASDEKELNFLRSAFCSKFIHVCSKPKWISYEKSCQFVQMFAAIKISDNKATPKLAFEK